MVCNRCVMVVKQLLDQLNISYTNVSMGEVELKNIEESNSQTLSKELLLLGFELLNDKEAKLVEKIKMEINFLINDDEKIKNGFKLSSYLSDSIPYDYNYLSTIFSSNQGVTIESYYLKLKIEKVKELLIYDELTLSEISYKLGYSSVAHLSSQFKKITGFTPTYFKTLKDNKKRKPLDKI